MKIILDLGCGRNKHGGAIGADNVLIPGIDLIMDLSIFAYPFKEGSVDEVIFSHVLEHFSVDAIQQILSEIYRILKPGGSITISVPHAMSPAFLSDPTHITRFTFETLRYFSKSHSFSYYKSLNARYDYQIERTWASVNTMNNHFVEDSNARLFINELFSKVMSRIVRNSKTLTLPDLVVKYMPFWLVSIHCKLRKT